MYNEATIFKVKKTGNIITHNLFHVIIGSVTLKLKTVKPVTTMVQMMTL